MIYKCPRCDYIFHTTQSIKNHIEKKKKCDSLISDIQINMDNIIVIENQISCEHCDRVYNNKYSLTKHLNTCKKYKEKQENQEKQEISERMKLLEEEMKQLKQHPSIINNTNTINNINSNNTTNISVVLGHEKTNTSFLTDGKLADYSRSIMLRTPNIIKDVHFDPNRPENHNMYISNIKSDFAHKYEGDTWAIVDKKDFIDDVVGIYERMIEAWENNPDKQKKYPSIKDNSDKYIDKSNEEGALDKMKKEIERLLYNNKAMVLETSRRNKIK